MKLSVAIVTTLIKTITCQEKVIVGYYTPWGNVPASKMDFKKVTHVNYAFGALVNHDKPANISLDKWYDRPKIKDVRKETKKLNKQFLLSLGGWTASQTFSLIMREESLKKTFIQNIFNLIEEYELDGIDLDWEFPNRAGAKCNVVHKDDTANYLVFLKELRNALDEKYPKNHKLITAAVRLEPFNNENGKPSSSVSEFARYFDFVNIMAYDIMGAFSKTTGPNAPFRANKKAGEVYSFVQSIENWLNAGFPADKLTAGLAFYGRSMTTKENMDGNSMYVPLEAVVPKGDETDDNKPNGFCDEGSVFSGVYKYKFLRQDILISNYTKATNGFTRYFDEVTQTPYVFNPSSKIFISYDDPQSIKIKLDYVKFKKLRGVMLWELSQDNGELIDVVQELISNHPHAALPEFHKDAIPLLALNGETNSSFESSKLFFNEDSYSSNVLLGEKSSQISNTLNLSQNRNVQDSNKNNHVIKSGKTPNEPGSSNKPIAPIPDKSKTFSGKSKCHH